jgi:hypothetical protein
MDETEPVFVTKPNEMVLICHTCDYWEKYNYRELTRPQAKALIGSFSAEHKDTGHNAVVVVGKDKEDA